MQQTAEQVQREGIAFSDLERRMMYFTEGPDATENPITLNEEFEAQYDTAEYETKIARLMGHAYRRLKKRILKPLEHGTPLSANFARETTTS